LQTAETHVHTVCSMSVSCGCRTAAPYTPRADGLRAEDPWMDEARQDTLRLPPESSLRSFAADSLALRPTSGTTRAASPERLPPAMHRRIPVCSRDRCWDPPAGFAHPVWDPRRPTPESSPRWRIAGAARPRQP